MPKKRFTSKYSKPATTIHPSLSSPATSSSITANPEDAQPTVNDLISSLRKSTRKSARFPVQTVTTPTLPPQIRRLLAQPETPAPRPRVIDRRRLDANGHVIPAGPAPPQSWVMERPLSALEVPKFRRKVRVFPTDVAELLPGLDSSGPSLRDVCLRTVAREWNFIQDFEKHNLAGLPTPIRMSLLSHIAVFGPDDGVGFHGLKNILTFPSTEDGSEAEISINNESFFRLDLSGAIGHSLSFKQVAKMVRPPSSSSSEEHEHLCWEDSLNLTISLSPPLTNLTHLSLSYPSYGISWPSLLSFISHIPKLTHLCLAFWPVPSATKYTQTAVMESKYGTEIQYGGINYYSHTLDEDFAEAADILRRLAVKLPILRYLDFTGCSNWFRALREHEKGNLERVLAWGKQWTHLQILKLNSGIKLNEESDYSEVQEYVRAFEEACATQRSITNWLRFAKAKGQRTAWLDVEKDDWMLYDQLWMDSGKEKVKKRLALDAIRACDQTGPLAPVFRSRREPEELGSGSWDS